MHSSTIGILAGMGPKSTAPFIDLVVKLLQTTLHLKYDIEFPPMMIYSLPTPFYIDRPIDHEAMAKTICQGLKRLETCQVDFIAMPCVTAHLYYEKLQKCVNVPLLNMIDLTLKSIPPKAKKIALLATRATAEAKVFPQFTLIPNFQSLIDELIRKIKEGSPAVNDLWHRIKNELLQNQIDTLILACTDLNLIESKISTHFQLVDSSFELAKEVVQKWKQK